jgi:1-acyl-sn-glycerol-3-phosphate acyltransferase
MTEALDRLARIAGTGTSFLLFGVGGALLGMLVSPVLGRVHREADARALRMQQLIQRSFRFFTRFMERVGVIEVTASGIEALRGPGPKLIVANHPTLIDYVLLGGLLPQMDCVVKRGLWDNPFLGGVVRGAGYIPNDDAEGTVQACVRHLREGRTLLLFPEGTRSPRGGLGRFQRGAAHVALETGLPLVPVTIRCVPPGLMRDQAWYDVPERRMQLTLDVGEAVQPKDEGLPRSLAARRLTRELRAVFAKEVPDVGA